MEELSGETEQPLQEQRKTFVSPKKLASKRKNANDSDRIVIQNLQNIMQDISDRRQTKKQKNSNTIFGEFIASKLEQFDDRTKTILQHQISTLIFNAELSYKFQPPTNQSQETSSSQIATSLPDLHSIYSIPPQSNNDIPSFNIFVAYVVTVFCFNTFTNSSFYVFNSTTVTRHILFVVVVFTTSSFHVRCSVSVTTATVYSQQFY